MILSCNSCGKKFVVPDNAISKAGRLVQCSACGNKWKQFPLEIVEKMGVISKPVVKKTITKPVKTKKLVSPKKSKSPKRKVPKKKREINLYSPEYLAKKHGIRINESNTLEKKTKKIVNNENFGFYNYLIVFTVVIIFVLRMIYFLQERLYKIMPFSEIYLKHLFETIFNIKKIILNFFFGY